MGLSLLLSGLLGGWLAADATALAQLLVSQPLVGGALTGWIWGDPWTGLRIGALLQLLALARLPLGGRTPDDFASAAVVAPSVAVLLGRNAFPATEGAVLSIGVASGLAVALLGRPMTRWLRARNEALVRWAAAEVEAGRAGALDRAQWLGVLHAAALGAFVVVAGIAVGVWLGRWAIGFDSLGLSRAARISEPLLWGLGAGLAARQFVQFRRGTGAVFVAVLALLLALRLASVP